MTTKLMFNEYGELCSDEAAEIARAIGKKVGDYVERVLKERRISLVEAYALIHYFAGQVDTSGLMSLMVHRCKLADEEQKNG